jgi:hypothetical protein
MAPSDTHYSVIDAGGRLDGQTCARTGCLASELIGIGRTTAQPQWPPSATSNSSRAGSQFAAWMSLFRVAGPIPVPAMAAPPIPAWALVVAMAARLQGPVLVPAVAVTEARSQRRFDPAPAGRAPERQQLEN